MYSIWPAKKSSWYIWRTTICKRPWTESWVAEYPFPDQNMLFNVLKELGVGSPVPNFHPEFRACPWTLQMNMFRYSQGFDDREVKRMEDYLQKAGRVFIRRGEAWVSRRYGDALISVFK